MRAAPPGPHAAGGTTGPAGIPTPAGPTPASTPRGKAAPVSTQPGFGIEWENTLRVSPTTTTGMTEAEAAAQAKRERPMLVYIYGEDEKSDVDPRYLVEEHRAFQDDEVLVAARFFDCLRIHAEDARHDRALKAYASKAPCLVLLRPNYRAVKCLRPKWTAEGIAGAMSMVLKKDFDNCVHCTLEAQQDLQVEAAEIEQTKAELAEVKAGDKREAMSRRVAEAEADLAKRRTELYTLKPKEA